tara:strand:- start:1010 stop:1183 length:174 start_codon:yes stop_codon:yes gene_type:complete
LVFGLAAGCFYIDFSDVIHFPGMGMIQSQMNYQRVVSGINLGPIKYKKIIDYIANNH